MGGIRYRCLKLLAGVNKVMTPEEKAAKGRAAPEQAHAGWNSRDLGCGVGQSLPPDANPAARAGLLGQAICREESPAAATITETAERRPRGDAVLRRHTSD